MQAKYYNSSKAANVASAIVLVVAGLCFAQPGGQTSEPPRVTVDMGFLKRGAVRDVSFSPDGRTLAVGMSGSLVLLDSRTWQVVKSWSRKECTPYSLAYSPEGDLIASTYKDQVVILDVDGKRKERYLNGHKGLVSELIADSCLKSLRS